MKKNDFLKFKHAESPRYKFWNQISYHNIVVHNFFTLIFRNDLSNYINSVNTIIDQYEYIIENEENSNNVHHLTKYLQELPA